MRRAHGNADGLVPVSIGLIAASAYVITEQRSTPGSRPRHACDAALTFFTRLSPLWLFIAAATQANGLRVIGP